MPPYLLNIWLLYVIAMGLESAEGQTRHSVLGFSVVTPNTAQSGQQQTTTYSGTEDISNRVEFTWPVVWTSWSYWSTCSSTIRTGFRIRNRMCPKEQCPGDDVQMIKCNVKDMNRNQSKYKRLKKYVDHCTRNRKGRTSLSCKLYLENPELAYNIFQQNTCFFTEEDESLRIVNSNKSQTSDTSPEEMSTVMSINSKFETSIRSSNLKPFKVLSKSRNNITNEEITNYTRRVLQALAVGKACRASCDATLGKMTRLWASGTAFAQSASQITNMLGRNDRFATGVGSMFYEHSKCLRNCKTTYSLVFDSSPPPKNISTDEPTMSQDDSTDEVVPNLRTREKRDSTRKPRSFPVKETEVTSLCEQTLQPCAEIRKGGEQVNVRGNRQKRQLGTQYVSPCFSQENQVPSYDIERKVNAELFFFESYVQKFNCRKCVGDVYKKNKGLYYPKEQVLSNNKPAYCRQGVLKRHALFIVEESNGRFAFRSGERFSIKSKTFDVESHCEIVVLK